MYDFSHLFHAAKIVNFLQIAWRRGVIYPLRNGKYLTISCRIRTFAEAKGK